MVQEHLLEPHGPQTPVQVQIVDQEGGHVLPAPVRHEAGQRQLPHVRVHEGDAGVPFFPALEEREVRLRPR